VVVDKRVAKRELEELLMAVSSHLRDLEAYRNEGDDAGEERSEWALKHDYASIRSHCAEHGLELPHDVPVRYQIPSGEESGTVRAAGAESSRRFLPHVAMVKATDTWQSDNFRAG